MKKNKQQNGKTRMLRGSLILLKRKCGKKNCRCVEGDPHKTPTLSYSIGGKTHLITLREKDIPEVKAGIRRYQDARNALEKKAMTGNEALRKKIAAEKTELKDRKKNSRKKDFK